MLSMYELVIYSSVILLVLVSIGKTGDAYNPTSPTELITLTTETSVKTTTSRGITTNGRATTKTTINGETITTRNRIPSEIKNETTNTGRNSSMLSTRNFTTGSPHSFTDVSTTHKYYEELQKKIDVHGGTTWIYVDMRTNEWIYYLGCYEDFNDKNEKNSTNENLIKLCDDSAQPCGLNTCNSKCTTFIKDYRYLGLSIATCYCVNRPLVTSNISIPDTCLWNENTFLGKNEHELAFYYRERNVNPAPEVCVVFQQERQPSEFSGHCKNLPYLEFNEGTENGVVFIQIRTVNWTVANFNCSEVNLLNKEDISYLLAVYMIEDLHTAGTVYPMANLSVINNQTNFLPSCEHLNSARRQDTLPFCLKYQCIILGASAGGVLVVILFVIVCCFKRKKKYDKKKSTHEENITMDPLQVSEQMNVYSMAVPIQLDDRITHDNIAVSSTQQESCLNQTDNGIVVPGTELSHYSLASAVEKSEYVGEGSTEYSELNRRNTEQDALSRPKLVIPEVEYNSLNHTLVLENEDTKTYDRVKPGVLFLIKEENKRFIGTEYDCVENIKHVST